MRPGQIARPAIPDFSDGITGWVDSDLSVPIADPLTLRDAPLLVIANVRPVKEAFKTILVLTKRGQLYWLPDYRLRVMGETGW